MITLVLEFDGASPQSLALLEALPEALAGRSMAVTLRPVAPPDGDPPVPWMALLAGPPPGRWVCEQVLRRGPVEAVEALAVALHRQPGGLSAPSGPVPALHWKGVRYAGDDALAALTAALPPA